MQMKPELLKCISEETSLENNIKIVCEMAFITLLSDLGYREDKGWTDDEDELLSSLIDSAHNLASSIMQEIRDYEMSKKDSLINISKDHLEKIPNDFFKEAWNIYQIVLLEKFEKDTMIAGHALTNLDSFINKIFNDEKFAKEWGFTVNIHELDLNERMWIYFEKHPDWAMSGTHSFFDSHNIPNKLITITYKNNTIEIYVFL